MTAARVARTETIRAANAATEDSFRESKVVTGKQWFTALDERVDDECAALDGKIVDLDDDFIQLEGVPSNYQDVGFPPIHPNCRCTLSPVTISRDSKPESSPSKPSAPKDDQERDFSKPAQVREAFDQEKYSKMTLEQRNTAVSQYIDQNLPTIKGLGDDYDWTLEVHPFDRLKIWEAGDAAKVDQYKAAFQKGDKFPTILAINPNGKNDFQVLDGAHRIEALKELNAPGIPVLVGNPKGYFDLSSLDL